MDQTGGGGGLLIQKKYGLLMSTSLVAIFLLTVSSVMPAFAADAGVGIADRKNLDDEGDPNSGAGAANKDQASGEVIVVKFRNGGGDCKTCEEIVIDAWDNAWDQAFSQFEIPDIKLDFSSLMKLLNSINMIVAQLRNPDAPFVRTFWSNLFGTIAEAWANDELVFPLGDTIVQLFNVFTEEVLDVFEKYNGFLGQAIIGGLLEVLDCLQKICNGEECGCDEEPGELPASVPLGATMVGMSLEETATQSASQFASQTGQMTTGIPEYGNKPL